MAVNFPESTLYLVSMIPRSGSSMMMRCLEAGGLTVVVNDNTPMAKIGDYLPNPYGNYEFEKDIDKDFYTLYAGMLIKCPYDQLIDLPRGKYKLIFMKRNPLEISASMQKCWGETLEFDYDLYVGDLLKKLSARDDMEIIVLNYADVIENPRQEFEKLDLPINISIAVSCVEPLLYRFKMS